MRCEHRSGGWCTTLVVCTLSSRYVTVVDAWVHFVQSAVFFFKMFEGPSMNCVSPDTAYVTLLTRHSSLKKSTALSGTGLQPQLALVLALVRSVRRVELCRRDFVLLHYGVTFDDAYSSSLEELGVRRKSVSPTVLGTPSADKLHAWALTDYRRVLFVDADAIAVRSLDALFWSDRAFVAGHHPSDVVQVQCGLSRRRRMIGGFFALVPSAVTYTALVNAVSNSKHNDFHLSHLSEQTALACHFLAHGENSVLPCPYFYDVNLLTGGWKRSDCTRWARFTISAACTLSVRECRNLADVAQCDEIDGHIERDCNWDLARREVRSVHFKGKRAKPWVIARRCRPVTDGAFRLRTNGSLVTLSVADKLVFRKGTCTSHGAPVVFATDSPVRSRFCCSPAASLAASLAAMWYGLGG